MMKQYLLFLMAAGMMSAAVDFEKQVKPVLEEYCLACHTQGRAAGNVRVDTKQAAWKAPVIVPGKPEASTLYTTLNLSEGNPKAMPPGMQLELAQRELIKQWIAEGANWPDNVTVGKAPATAAKKQDEQATVAQIHARIVKKSVEKTPADMTPYTETIPLVDVKFDMLPIPAGEFTMGTPASEKARGNDEGPQRKVKIDAFWMGKHEVTWDEYRLFMFAQSAKEERGSDTTVDAVSRPTKPYVEMSFGMGLNGFPAISMTQHAANKYAQWLSSKTGHFYRLPTEAEWEYACRAGTSTAYSFGDDEAKLNEYAWFAANSGDKYQQVGKKKPNPWGLHDMHGNVVEWTLDQYDEKGYAGLSNENPWRVATTPYPHVARGGGWADGAASLRCGARLASDPSWKQQDPQLPKSIWYLTDAQWLGFRLVRPLKVPSVMEMYRYWNSGVERE